MKISERTRSGLIARDNFSQYNQSVARLYAPHDGFGDAMYRAGVMTDVPIVADGKIHRFKPEGEKRPNGWYVFFGYGGAFGNWRTGLKETWFNGDTCQANRRKLQSQIRAAQKAHRKKQDRKHRESAKIAAHRWNAATPAIEHPYLTAKNVLSHGLRVEDRNLLVPVCLEQQIWSLQIISPAGQKKFHMGGRTGGCYYPIGFPTPRIWLAEGYATAATVHELTGESVVCAFNASNLIRVASHIRMKFADKEIYIAADNDKVGIDSAMQAMKQHDLEGVKWPDENKADWNDFCALHGATRALEALS